jgi:hypothetical protein
VILFESVFTRDMRPGDLVQFRNVAFVLNIGLLNPEDGDYIVTFLHDNKLVKHRAGYLTKYCIVKKT